MLGAPGVFAQAPSAPATSAAPAAVAPVPITLGIPIGNVRQVSGLAEYINLGYRYMVSIVLIAAIIMVVWGGFRYLLGSANIGNVQRGKEIIRDAVVGMLIVIGAFVILNTVNPRTVELRNLSLSSIQRQDMNLSVAGGARTECSSDADCTAGSRCVEAEFIFNSNEYEALGMTFGGGGLGAAAGGYVGGVYGAIIGGVGGVAFGSYHAIGHRSMRCSDGSANAPCSENAHCSGGNVCYTNWHLCGPVRGQPVGGACQENSHCANSNCEEVPSSYLGQGVLEGNPAHCRGQIGRLTDEVYRIGDGPGRGFRVPESHRCAVNEDCVAGQGLTCGGPPGLGTKFCHYSDSGLREHPSEDGTICFSSGGNISPTDCGGTSTPLSCMYCPTEGTRVWQRVQTGDPRTHIVGLCRERSILTTPCAGPSSP